MIPTKENVSLVSGPAIVPAPADPLEAARAEWLASGVSPEIFDANVSIVQGEAAAEALNLAERISDKTGTFTTATGRLMASVIEDGGWWVTGLDPDTGFSTRSAWGKLKPFTPRQKQGAAEIQRYEQPWGVSARAAFLAVPSKPDFWPSVASDPTKPIYICEGEKKAGLLLSLGYPAISVSGIWNATVKDGNYGHKLIPDLKRFATKGRQVIFVYDAEGQPRKAASVYKALKTAGREFQGYGCEVSWVTWDAEQGKGIDDLWANHGAEAVTAALAEPYSLKSYEAEQFCVTTTPDNHVFERLFEAGRGDWVVINQAFYRYSGKGYWRLVSDEQVQKSIANFLRKCYRLTGSGKDKIPTYNVATDRAVTSSFKFCLKALAACQQGNKATGLRVFDNGTLNLESGELREHRKDDYLTSRIDAPFIPNRPCPKVFEEFVASSFGLENLPLVRATISMFLDPSAPWGYFLYILGQSGGGKGTLTRFIEGLFDSENVRSGADFSDLKTPEGRHQHLKGCSLYCVPDSGGHLTGVRSFYELVDNGPMSGRPLFSSVTYQERFNTRFIIASVEPLTIENAGDGWERRAIVLPVKSGKRDKDFTLESRLAAARADVISWALSMPKDERNHVLTHSSEVSESTAEAKRSVTMSGDSVRQFIDNCLIPVESGEGATLAEIHGLYRVYAKAFGYSDMGASRLGARLQSVLPDHYEPRRKLRADEPDYRPNKFVSPRYNVRAELGVFSRTEEGEVYINKGEVKDGNLDLFIPPKETDVIDALNRCQSWGEYCGIVERYGVNSVRENWEKLPLEVRNRIASLQQTTPPAAPAEPAEPEPLSQEEVTALTAAVLAAVDSQDTGFLVSFKSSPKLHKQQVWDATPGEKKDRLQQAMLDLEKPRQIDLTDGTWEEF
jgi:phage/plasmid-associated DNA primase